MRRREKRKEVRRGEVGGRWIPQKNEEKERPLGSGWGDKYVEKKTEEGPSILGKSWKDAAEAL